MGKHSLLVDVFLLTHFAINPCSTALCIMVSRQRGQSKGCGGAQTVSTVPGPALHPWAMKFLPPCLPGLRATMATKSCDTCFFPSRRWGRRVSSLTCVSQRTSKQFTLLIRAANAERLVKQGNSLTSVAAKYQKGQWDVKARGANVGKFSGGKCVHAMIFTISFQGC